MNLQDVVSRLQLKPACAASLDVEVTGGYVSDLLSDVIANAREGSLWVTLQTHQNIVAVAALKDLAGIVIINGKQPARETVQKAEQEAIPILSTELPAFEIVCRLCKLGITGSG